MNCGEDGMTALVGTGGLCGGYRVAWGLVRKERKIMCSALQKEMSTCIDFFLCSFCVNFVSLSPPAFFWGVSILWVIVFVVAVVAFSGGGQKSR